MIWSWIRLGSHPRPRYERKIKSKTLKSPLQVKNLRSKALPSQLLGLFTYFGFDFGHTLPLCPVRAISFFTYFKFSLVLQSWIRSGSHPRPRYEWKIKSKPLNSPLQVKNFRSNALLIEGVFSQQLYKIQLIEGGRWASKDQFKGNLVCFFKCFFLTWLFQNLVKV